MKNRTLEREKDTISYIIDDLVKEIESLESVINNYVGWIEDLENKIEQLENNQK